MLRRAQEVFDYVKQSIQTTNDDLMLSAPSRSEQELKQIDQYDGEVEFQREVIKILFEQCRQWRHNVDFRSHLYFIELIKIILYALFASLYKKGRCDEHACLAFVELLKKGINKSIEMAEIEGETITKKAQHVYGDIARHSLVLIDRAKYSEWRQVIKLDSWGEQEVKMYNKTAFKSFGVGFLRNIEEIEYGVRFEENLTPALCEQIILALHNISTCLTESMLVDASHRIGVTSIDISKQLPIIRKKLEEEIKSFEAIKNHPPLFPDASVASVLVKSDATLFGRINPDIALTHPASSPCSEMDALVQNSETSSCSITAIN